MIASLKLRYDVSDLRGAISILESQCPDEAVDVLHCLNDFSFTVDDIVSGGGNKSRIADRINSSFFRRGWEEKKYSSETRIDFDSPYETCSIGTHIIDACKGRVALEIEWNNKDTFFGRDVGAFNYLHATGKIDCAVIITRSWSLRSLFASVSRDAPVISQKYGKNTTHDQKLTEYLVRDIHGSCPILGIAITDRCLDRPTRAVGGAL